MSVYDSNLLCAHAGEAFKYVVLHAMCIGQRAITLPVLFQPYLLQVMYMTLQYVTVSCIPTTDHVYDISIRDSFMYTCFSLLPADMHDLYTVIWQCTGEALASQMMLLGVARSGSPHNVPHLH